MIKLLMPTYHRIEQFGNSIRSVLSSMTLEHLTPDEIHIYIYDNASLPEMRTALKTIAERFPHIFTVVLGKKNIGKAKALNTFMDQIEPDDIVVSMDSDIVISCTGFFRTGLRLIRTFDVSAVAAWQVVNNHHKIEQEWQDAAGGYHYKTDKIGKGIAGGCFFTTGATWKLVKGYRENRGLFGGNDGYFFYDAGTQTGKPVWVCQELVVTHPPDTDAGYAAWKKTAQEQQVAHSKCMLDRGYWDKPKKVLETETPGGTMGE